MTKVAEPLFIESTAGQVAAEPARLGIDPNQPVTIMVEPENWLAEVRRVSRPWVVAQGWSDEDIDRIIEEERDAVRLGWDQACRRHKRLRQCRAGGLVVARHRGRLVGQERRIPENSRCGAGSLRRDQRPRLADGIPPLHVVTLRRIFAAAEIVTVTESVVACRDPKDGRFLELAVNGDGDVIVAGDADLLVLNPYRDISILSPTSLGRAMMIRRT
jgi:hypothetical protein